MRRRGDHLSPNASGNGFRYHQSWRWLATTLAWFRSALTLDESYLVRIEGCNGVQYKYVRDVALLLQYS